MGVIGIGALMSRCAEIWETESVLLAELQQCSCGPKFDNAVPSHCFVVGRG